MSDNNNERVVDLLSVTYLRVGDPVNNLTINEVVFFPHLNKLAKFTNIPRCLTGCIFRRMTGTTGHAKRLVNRLMEYQSADSRN